MKALQRFAYTVLAGVLVAVVAGCKTSPPPLPGGGQRSNLTPGMVKKHLNKGATTQTEVYTVFGPPNIIMTDQEGREVWTYDVQSTSHTAAETEKSGSGGGAVGAGGVAGGAVIGGGLGGGGGGSKRTSTGQVSSTTFTLMITFDQNSVVQDYRMLSTQF